MLSASTGIVLREEIRDKVQIDLTVGVQTTNIHLTKVVSPSLQKHVLLLVAEVLIMFTSGPSTNSVSAISFVIFACRSQAAQVSALSPFGWLDIPECAT
jgi:hypothetical protein